MQIDVGHLSVEQTIFNKGEVLGRISVLEPYTLLNLGVWLETSILSQIQMKGMNGLGSDLAIWMNWKIAFKMQC